MTDPSSGPDAIRERLIERLAAVRDASAGTADTRRPVALDQAAVGRVSRIDAMQMQSMAMAAERNRQDEARRIEATIRRIDEGEFGWCVTCGEAIAPKRLATDPTIATCIRCASGADR